MAKKNKVKFNSEQLLEIARLYNAPTSAKNIKGTELIDRSWIDEGCDELHEELVKFYYFVKEYKKL